MDTIFMPLLKVFEFMQTPINFGRFQFSYWQFVVALLAMDLVITAIWRYLDGD